MLRIREEQIKSFNDKRHRDIVKFIMQHSREHWSKKSEKYNDKELYNYIEIQLRNAELFDIKNPKEQLHYVNQSFVWGETFHRDENQDWILQILNDKTLSGSAKVFQLRNKTPEKINAMKKVSRNV